MAIYRYPWKGARSVHAKNSISSTYIACMLAVDECSFKSFQVIFKGLANALKHFRTHKCYEDTELRSIQCKPPSYWCVIFNERPGFFFVPCVSDAWLQITVWRRPAGSCQERRVAAAQSRGGGADRLLAHPRPQVLVHHQLQVPLLVRFTPSLNSFICFRLNDWISHLLLHPIEAIQMDS